MNSPQSVRLWRVAPGKISMRRMEHTPRCRPSWGIGESYAHGRRPDESILHKKARTRRYETRVANRPLIREQALGEPLDPDKLERRFRRFTHFENTSKSRPSRARGELE